MTEAVSLTADELDQLRSEQRFNADLAPTELARRTWSRWRIAALWVGMSVCIPTDTLASSLIAQGMSWWEANLTVLLGNVIVLVPMILNAHAGTKYGIPFPVLARTSFGTLGSNVPALLRANLAPRRISFKTGGLITALVGILIMPWRLYSDPTGYIFTWLIGYSALLGPIGGILIADYYFVRRCTLALPDMYKSDGEYRYAGGYNPKAMVALSLGIAPNVPGFLGAIGAVSVGHFWSQLYGYAWFNGFIIAGLVYLGLMWGERARLRQTDA